MDLVVVELLLRLAEVLVLAQVLGRDLARPRHGQPVVDEELPPDAGPLAHEGQAALHLGVVLGVERGAHERGRLALLLGVLPHGAHHLRGREPPAGEHLVAAGLRLLVDAHVHLHGGHGASFAVGLLAAI